MNFCPHCRSGNDPVLKDTNWSCGVKFNDTLWRTNECYKRQINLKEQHIVSNTPRTDVLLIAHDMANISLISHSRELERELNAANDRIKRLEDALEHISKEVPAHDGNGGLFWPMFDRDGNEIGVQNVDPLTVIGAIHTRALDALRGEEAKEAKP